MPLYHIQNSHFGFKFIFGHLTGTKSRFPRDTCANVLAWGKIVIGRLYFARQAATLLKFARSTTDPQLAAVLIEKAADLKSQVDEWTPMPDTSVRAPDVQS